MIGHSVPKCPACQGVTELAFFTKDYNRRTAKKSFCYYRCKESGLIFLYPVPPDLGRYYPTDYYPLPSSLKQLELEAGHEKYKIELISRFVGSGRVLDIGAGYGRFVYLAHKAGYQVDAIEINSECCEFITTIIGTRAIVHAQPEVALVDLEPYDGITFWHVIEHLADPWSVMKAAVQKLRIGGWLIVAMPNPESLQFRVFRQYRAHVDSAKVIEVWWREPLALLRVEAAIWLPYLPLGRLRTVFKFRRSSAAHERP
jgi:2-polyprenyl-3-methyl-5-hydroxy-6-metoxy-1,4-benzoquinol methylase